MINRMLVLGAAGDLTSRLLVPGLEQLREGGHLPDSFEVVGVDRADADVVDVDAKGLRYVQGDVTSAEDLRRLFSDSQPCVAYLALPPAVFGPAIEALRDAGLPAGSRLVVEKPFGEDLADAQRLNSLVHELLPEDAVFRVDHFLGLQTVQNILGLRFANRIFEPVWNAAHVERVEIVWDETLTLEGRAGYYDSAGALRDMVQNHLLQLLCLVAMEPPRTLDAVDLQDRKVEVLKAVRRLNSDEVEKGSRRARYTAGRVGSRDVPAYSEEDGVDPQRQTETFAEVELAIDNWRWSGVPFILRSGKALPANCHEVVVHFKRVPHLAFGQDDQPPGNALRLQIEPDRMALDVAVNAAGDPFQLEPGALTHVFPDPVLGPYARLLLAILDGDPRLSIRADEAEESWRIVEPVLAEWEKETVTLLEYPAGSRPPSLLTREKSG